MAEENKPVAEEAAAKEEKKEEIKEEKDDVKAGLKDYGVLRPGMTVRVYQRIKELNTKGEEKERSQYFEGIIIARKHGKEVGATITVRKTSEGVGVEKIFPLNSPTIDKIILKKEAQVRRAKLNYLGGFKRILKEKIIK